MGNSVNQMLSAMLNRFGLLGASIAGPFGSLRKSKNSSTMVPTHGGKPRKGQIRNAKSKASGAAQLKRAAKKRNNIRKHK